METKTAITVQLYFRWFDLWIGAYYSKVGKAVYIQLIPMIGVRIGLPRKIIFKGRQTL